MRGTGLLGVGALALFGAAQAFAGVTTLAYDTDFTDDASYQLDNLNSSSNGWVQHGSVDLPAVNGQAAIVDDAGAQLLQIRRNDSLSTGWTPYDPSFSHTPDVANPSIYATFGTAVTPGNDQALFGFYAKQSQSDSDPFVRAGFGSDGHIYAIGGSAYYDLGTLEPYSLPVADYAVYIDVYVDVQQHKARTSVFDGVTELLSFDFAIPSTVTHVDEMGLGAYKADWIGTDGVDVSTGNFYDLIIEESPTAIPEPTATAAGLGGTLLLGIRRRQRK